MSENGTLPLGSALSLSDDVHPPSEPDAESVDSNLGDAAALEVPASSNDAQANDTDGFRPNFSDQNKARVMDLFDQSGELEPDYLPRIKPIQPSFFSFSSPSAIDRAKSDPPMTGTPVRERPARPPYPESLGIQRRNGLNSASSNSSMGGSSHATGVPKIGIMMGSFFRKKKTNSHDTTYK